MSALREAHQRIRGLERLLRMKQMEIEILQAPSEEQGYLRQPPRVVDGEPDVSRGLQP